MTSLQTLKMFCWLTMRYWKNGITSLHWRGMNGFAGLLIVKKQETREKHLIRLQEDILNSKKRPCCWPGCPHRRESAKKWFKNLDE